MVGQVFSGFGRFLNHVTSLGGRAPEQITRFLRYVASSGSMVVLDLLILGFLTEYFEVYYLVSVAISFTVSNSCNYLINRNWGFRETRTHFVGAYFLFLLFGIFGLGLTISLMWVFVDLLFVHYLFARVVVYVIEGTLGFVLNSVFTFRIPLMGISRED